MKSTGFHEICMKSARFHEIHLKSGGFHEIQQISGEIHPNWRVFAETSEFIRFWVDFTWNPLDFMKSVWNPVDFMKSARFQVKSTGFQIMSFCVMIKYRSFDFRKTNQMFQQKLFWLVFWKMKDLYLIITQKLIILKSSGFHADFMWNPVDFMKSLVIAPTLHSSNWRVFAETLAFIILGGFHRWNLGELCWISQVKSLVIAPTLHSSNWRVFAETLAFIILGGFHRWYLGEIHWISQVKSTRFQGEIHWISRVKSPTLHSSNWRVFAETLAFIILVDFTGDIWVKSTRFHEICQISPEIHWILPEICWISQISWNPPDFMVKSAGFHGEIRWISPEIRRISWNPYEIRRISWNVSFCVMIKYRSFFRKTKHQLIVPNLASEKLHWGKTS